MRLHTGSRPRAAQRRPANPARESTVPRLPAAGRTARETRRLVSIRRNILVPLVIVLGVCVAPPSRATDGPLFLFGGPNRDQFLGCLNCYRSETFSVWNERLEYGSTIHPDSIWNREGAYGSPSSPLSPWNPNAPNPPLVVDRVGNLYGYLTLNPSHPERVRRDDSHPRSADFRFLVWLLDNYDWVVTHLDEVRAQY